ncbi:N,N-dimethylformamidase beta subunit family domain-containing protein [Thioalkalivibrio sp. HK1]|uniref:N,N-dimethylformamidase beta subunit family domain-containing protein n=1 Tax=Thioalkalivibrio sp. HK1 TaxID=1469245 RepID=UPI000470C4FE|nr:N,N-dimethylformamidase beta subunit family domain-containing protein [Thioalkalivibrio sp. HK1]
MLPLTGYADRLSLRPGQTIRFHVSNATGIEAQASIVRILCADGNPAGPGIITQAIDDSPIRCSSPGPQHSPRGSYARIDDAGRCFATDVFSILCLIWPTRLTAGRQAIVSLADPDSADGFTLGLDEAGRLCVNHGVSGGDIAVVQEPLVERNWYAIWLTVDGGDRSKASQGMSEIDLGFQPLHPRLGAASHPRTVRKAASLEMGGALSAPLLLAASDPARPKHHFNGKIEAPCILDRPPGEAEIDALAQGKPIEAAVAAWDFSRGIASSRIEDCRSKALHGRLFNTPARGMTGACWRAKEMCWRHALREYAAIHFHDDDIDDCGWPVAFEWTVPSSMRSGAFALLLSAGDAQDNIPFFIVPPKGRATADLAILVSTFTYTVYGNHARPEWSNDADWRERWKRQSSAWGANAHNPGDHVEYGLSTYNTHSDGSGISIASWHRPMLNLRIGYITYPDPEIRGSGMRHFPADTHLIAWLEAKGIAYDLISDQELHDEGVDLLGNYRTLMTGSHPEYHTPRTLDAIEAWRDRGGRLCYLGGNGFYWKVALSPEKEGVIEIRRGEGGIRAWAAEPGEYYNQFDGEYGGLWRRNGRPPQNLCGVGFTAQGNYAGSYYRKCPEAGDPRVDWMFEGIEGDVFGDHGLGGHGAAGFELDRADKRLGTPEHALVVAASENHPPDTPWVLVPEEQLTHIVTWPGEPYRDLIRADMVFFETPAGGAVFSVGSITFCGSLPSEGFDNDISRLLENVLRRFLDPEPFRMPDP